MKKILGIIVLILFSEISFGQILIHRVDNPKFIVGSHTSFLWTFGRDALNQKFHELFAEAEPYVSYFPFRDLGFGVMADYLYVNSTINNFKNCYSAGTFVRYYLPFQINKETLGRQKFYFEYNINYTNYEFENRINFPRVDDKLSNIRVNYVVGVNVFLINEFYVDIACQYMKFVDGIGIIKPRLAFEYHFNK